VAHRTHPRRLGEYPGHASFLCEAEDAKP
jgi:hypothetical protein